jgi:hypothetical protein
VPTQPIFCPREEAVPERTASPLVEPEIYNSFASLSRQSDAGLDSSSWIFSSPSKMKPDVVIEEQIPPSEPYRTVRQAMQGSGVRVQ